MWWKLFSLLNIIWSRKTFLSRVRKFRVRNLTLKYHMNFLSTSKYKLWNQGRTKLLRTFISRILTPSWYNNTYKSLDTYALAFVLTENRLSKFLLNECINLKLSSMRNYRLKILLKRINVKLKLRPKQISPKIKTNTRTKTKIRTKHMI